MTTPLLEKFLAGSRQLSAHIISSPQIPFDGWINFHASECRMNMDNDDTHVTYNMKWQNNYFRDFI